MHTNIKEKSAVWISLRHDMPAKCIICGCHKLYLGSVLPVGLVRIPHT